MNFAPQWSRWLQSPACWSATLAMSLALFHLTLVDQGEVKNLFSLSLLIWLTLASLLWDKRDRLTFTSDLSSTLLGTVIFLLMLIRSLNRNELNGYLLPLIGGLSLMLIISGSQRLREYWREIMILSLLIICRFLASFLKSIDLPTLTAQFSSLLLGAIGFSVQREGVILQLSTGRVEVYGACSGVDSILLMFCVSVLFLFLIPVNAIQKVVCVVVGILIGFIVNSLRVALLAVLVNANQMPSFVYWHSDDGSLLFAAIAVGLFGAFCWFAYVQRLSVPPNPGAN
ncbi:MAG: cyanoexosortase A [Microcystaceae cyanobacterium]